jgi:hypothetical protein
VGLGIARPQRKRLPELLLRLFEPPLRIQDIAEIVVAFHVSRIERYGPPIMRLGLTHAAKRVQGAAKIAMEIRYSAVAGDCLANEIYRELGVAALVRHDTEKMQTAGVVGVDGKDLAIQALGLVQSPGLMKFTAAFQRLLGVEHAAPPPPPNLPMVGRYEVLEDNGNKKAQMFEE